MRRKPLGFRSRHTARLGAVARPFLAAAASNCLTVEYFRLEEYVYNFERLLKERLVARDGWIALPQRPGLGLALDDEAIARYTVV